VLTLQNVGAGYGSFQALFDVALEVGAARARFAEPLSFVYKLFPRLEERAARPVRGYSV
jgi:ABC-type branched-subunit amino acid transport system ATPase component